MNDSRDTTTPAVPLRFQEGTPDAVLLRLQQECQDTQQRMRLGGLFYVVGWVFIVLAGGPQDRNAWLVGLALLALALARFLYPLPPEADAATLRLWLRWPWFLIVAACVMWGFASAWVLAEVEYDSARTVVLFGGVAFATASAHGFSMRRRFAITTVVLLMGPAITVLAFLRHETTLAWAMLVYLGYLGLAVERSHREWLQRSAL
ncbi:MAG: hypothetical protein ABIP49_09370, partial [Lysobacterales bacterium]